MSIINGTVFEHYSITFKNLFGGGGMNGHLITMFIFHWN